MTPTKPPKKNKSDAVHAVARAALGAIPIAGSAAVELFTAIVAPPLEKRRDAWMQEIGEAMQDLKDNRGVDVEGLKDNPAFIDTALQASQIALRTGQEEKRAALRNALLNAALPAAPEQSRQQMFLNWIESLTVWHIRLLRLFDDPAAWYRDAGRKPPDLYAGSLAQVAEDAFRELRGQRAFYDQVWSELRQKGLTNTDSLHGVMTGPGTLQRRTTELATEFIKFISAPAQQAT